MKKILLISLLASSSVFATQPASSNPESTYLITTSIYAEHGSKKDLVASASQILLNDGKENPTVVSREIQAPLSLTEGLNFNSRILKSQKGDILDYTGQISTIMNVSKSEDSKWQEGNLKVVTFKNSMVLNKETHTYNSSYDSDNKKYLLEIKTEKIDNISKDK